MYKSLSNKPKAIKFVMAEQSGETKETRWLIQDMIPRGKLVLLSAEGGIGKTSVAAHLAMSLAERGYRVVYWSFEDNPDDFTNKGMYHHNVSLLSTEGDEVFTFTEDNITELQNFMYENMTDLLIIDPIAQCLDDDQNDNIKVRKLLSAFVRMAEDLDMAVLGIHHFRKPGRSGSVGDIKHNATGAAAWVNTPRHCLSMVRGKDNKLWLEVTKSNVGPTGTSWAIHTRIGNGTLQVTELDRADDYAAQSAVDGKKREPDVIVALKEKFGLGTKFTLDDVREVGCLSSFYNWVADHKGEYQNSKIGNKKAYFFV